MPPPDDQPGDGARGTANRATADRGTSAVQRGTPLWGTGRKELYHAGEMRKRLKRPPANLRVNPASSLKSGKLITMLYACKALPAQLKRGFGATANALTYSTPSRFSHFSGEAERTWIWELGALNSLWEITRATLCIDVSERGISGQYLEKDLQKAREKGQEKDEAVTDLVSDMPRPSDISAARDIALGIRRRPGVLLGKTIPSIDMALRTREHALAEVARLWSKRGLIVLATDVVVRRPNPSGGYYFWPPKRPIRVPATLIVETLLRELVEHAVPLTMGEPAEHGTGNVDRRAEIIQKMFAQDPNAATAKYEFGVEVLQSIAQATAFRPDVAGWRARQRK